MITKYNSVKPNKANSEDKIKEIEKRLASLEKDIKKLYKYTQKQAIKKE